MVEVIDALGLTQEVCWQTVTGLSLQQWSTEMSRARVINYLWRFFSYDVINADQIWPDAHWSIVSLSKVKDEENR